MRAEGECTMEFFWTRRSRGASRWQVRLPLLGQSPVGFTSVLIPSLRFDTCKVCEKDNMVAGTGSRWRQLRCWTMKPSCEVLCCLLVTGFQDTWHPTSWTAVSARVTDQDTLISITGKALV